MRRITKGKLGLGLSYKEACNDLELCAKLARRSAKCPETAELRAYAQATQPLRDLATGTTAAEATPATKDSPVGPSSEGDGGG